MKRRTRALGGQRPAPEFRLWSSYLGFACVVVGLVVFCVQLDRAVPLHWNVTPLVGIAIAAFGNQIVTTVLITCEFPLLSSSLPYITDLKMYDVDAIDCHHEHSASIGVFIGLVRQLWGFIGPFWFPDMFTTLGLGGSAGLCAGLVVAVSVLPIALLQWVGGSKSIE